MADGAAELRAISATLQAEEGQIGAKAAAVVRASAHRVEALSKGYAPVDTGYLRNSITSSVEGDGRMGAMSAEIGPEAGYAAHLEFGTERMAPRPFMGPAAAKVEPSFVAAMEAIAGLEQ